MKYVLEDAEKRSREHPQTFFVPALVERERLQLGDLVKLIFIGTGQRPAGERMWVEVTYVDPLEGRIRYRGELKNEPVTIDDLTCGTTIDFEPRHVAGIERRRHGVTIDHIRRPL